MPRDLTMMLKKLIWSFWKHVALWSGPIATMAKTMVMMMILMITLMIKATRARQIQYCVREACTESERRLVAVGSIDRVRDNASVTDKECRIYRQVRELILTPRCPHGPPRAAVDGARRTPVEGKAGGTEGSWSQPVRSAVDRERGRDRVLRPLCSPTTPVPSTTTTRRDRN